MDPTVDLSTRYDQLAGEFPHWEKTKDLVDQCLDITLNYRQSGHPGGSRSKVHAFLALLLSGAMRWDIRRPEKRFGDRFILGGGHAVPLVYCTLAVLNQAMRLKFQQTGDPRYALCDDSSRVLTWEDLLRFRENGGLSGHAEMEGKTLFLKFNTGPSGHGAPAAAGEALALKRAGAGQVKVFFLDGEGGLTPGGVHETINSAWGLGLDNLYFLVDWNDYGIDDHRVSASVYGTPKDWFSAHGWRIFGAEQGSEWPDLTTSMLQMTGGDHSNHSEPVPSVLWFKTRKGRGYGTYDNKSHGTPNKPNSELFWRGRSEFSQKYGVRFANQDGPLPAGPEAVKAEFRANLQVVMNSLEADQGLVDYLTNRLVELGDSVPEEISGFRLSEKHNPFADPRLYDFEHYPSDLFAQPGEKVPNRAALGKWGAWVNALGGQDYGRPLFLVASADLTESTNLSGFGAPYGDFPGYGWYERHGSAEGVMLPQEITEFTNAGIMAGLATVNFSKQPESEFQGFWGACSTYGSFSYLKYGPFRLFSQLAQDCQWKVGKVIWIAGHSGPETAEDSRTHFGVFSPGVTQLFPEGQIINLHPWEYNEVQVLLGAALSLDVPIIALHLTRPPIEIPDRAALGMPSHYAAARGAYLVRDYVPGKPRGGAVIVQGTSVMANLVKVLSEIDRQGWNIKIICATSSELFARQSEEYRHSILSPADQIDSTVITTGARSLMRPWLFTKTAEHYALSADWDNRWRTGGRVEDVLEEAHLSPEWILEGIQRFVEDRSKRLREIEEALREARK